MRLIDQWRPCPVCDERLDYIGLGEWECECGHNELADWLDGPAFVAWLEEVANLPSEDEVGLEKLNASLYRRLTAWRNGSPANVYAADRHLVWLNLSLSDLPDELWIERPSRKTTIRLSPEQAQEAIARIEAGESKTIIARDFGVTAKTIQNHWLRHQTVAA